MEGAAFGQGFERVRAQRLLGRHGGRGEGEAEGERVTEHGWPFRVDVAGI